jgi:hypothetical protein
MTVQQTIKDENFIIGQNDHRRYHNCPMYTLRKDGKSFHEFCTVTFLGSKLVLSYLDENNIEHIYESQRSVFNNKPLIDYRGAHFTLYKKSNPTDSSILHFFKSTLEGYWYENNSEGYWRITLQKEYEPLEQDLELSEMDLEQLRISM